MGIPELASGGVVSNLVSMTWIYVLHLILQTRLLAGVSGCRKPVLRITDLRVWAIWLLLVFAAFSNVVQNCDLQITATDRGPLID